MKTVSMETVIKAYYRGRPDGHWFDRDTMRFFKCRLTSVAYEATNGRRFFVTSERREYDTPRLYTVRVQEVDGDVSTMGEFQGYRSNAAATREAKRLANEAPETGDAYSR